MIEALSTGTPVIAATGSCLEEAGGDAAIYVGPDDTDAYIHVAQSLTDDDNLRRALLDRAPAHLARFDPTLYAARLKAIYDKAIEQF